MSRAHILCYDVQPDRPEVAAEVIFLTITLMVEYDENKEYKVVDTPQNWRGTTPFKTLPRVRMTTNPTRSCVDLPLMTYHSIALVKRYKESIEEFFGKENPDRLLAMILNPFMAIHGFGELNELRDDGNELFEKAKVLLSDMMMKEVVKTKPVSTTAVVNNVEQTTEPANIALPPMTSRLERRDAHRRTKKLRIVEVQERTTDETVADAINKYLKQNFDPESVLND